MFLALCIHALPPIATLRPTARTYEYRRWHLEFCVLYATLHASMPRFNGGKSASVRECGSSSHRCPLLLSKYFLTLTPGAYATLVIMLLLHMVTVSCSLFAYHPRVRLCGSLELSGLGGLSE